MAELTLNEAARKYAVSPTTVMAWMKEGRITGRKDVYGNGKQFRYLVDAGSLEAYAANGKLDRRRVPKLAAKVDAPRFDPARIVKTAMPSVEEMQGMLDAMHRELDNAEEKIRALQKVILVLGHQLEG